MGQCGKAVPAGRWPRCNAVAYIDVGQTGAFTECRIPDAGHTVGIVTLVRLMQ